MAKKLTKSILALGLCATALTAHASLMGSVPVPSSAYITQNGLDWAWAYPLEASGGLDLSDQSANGWRLPTAAELANAPVATDFMKPDGNVPLGGQDPVSLAQFQATNANLTSAAACATPYFSNSYRHCDWSNGLGQSDHFPWAGMPGSRDFSEQLVVRPAAAAAVPTLGLESLGLLGLGLLGMGGWSMRRRQAGRR